MERSELETVVDRLYELSDAEVIRILGLYLAEVRRQTVETRALTD